MISQSQELTATVNGKSITLRYPGDPFLKIGIESVLSGKDYPVSMIPPHYPIHTIIDVGANIGDSARYFHAHFPEATLFCYEPSKINHHYLTLNTQGISQIQNFRYALSDREGELPLYYPATHHLAALSLHSRDGQHHDSEMVQVRKISDEIQRFGLREISLIKLDCEVSETEVASDLLLNVNDCFIGCIFVEYHDAYHRTIIDTLFSHEYTRHQVHSQGEQGTVLFINKMVSRMS